MNEQANNPECKLGGQTIEQVTNFNYLGIVFNDKGDRSTAQKDLNQCAMKAMFGLIRSMDLLPKAKVAFHFFDHLIKPILMYGCEVWGPINLDYRAMRDPKSDTERYCQII